MYIYITYALYIYTCRYIHMHTQGDNWDVLTIRYLCICISQENCAVLWVSVHHSSSLATNYAFQPASGFLCFPSTFLLRNSLLSINSQLSCNSLFLQRCLADCLWPSLYPTSSCKLKPMFKHACADKVSVSIYPNPWADGHSHAVGNLVKGQEQVGICTVEVAAPASGFLD